MLLDWQIAPGYYLYREQFSVNAGGEPLVGAVDRAADHGQPAEGDEDQTETRQAHGEGPIEQPWTSRHYNATPQSWCAFFMAFMPRTRCT